MARGLKFRIQEEEGLYYLSSENKGADQLHGGNREADLRLCFCMCKKPVFSRRGSDKDSLAIVHQAKQVARVEPGLKPKRLVFS